MSAKKGDGKTMLRIFSLLMIFIAGWYPGCSSAKPDAKEPGTPSVEEAEQIVDAYAARLGIATARSVSPAPVSLPEVIDIFKQDDVARFQQAITYLRGVQGLDALALRAAFEIFGAGMQLGIADYLSMSADKIGAQSSYLVSKKEKGETLTADQENSLNQLKNNEQELKNVSNALKVLAEQQLQAGMSSADEAIGLYPDKPEGYSAKASVYRLRGEWKEYDVQVSQAARLKGDDQSFGLTYQKACEAWKRGASPDEAVTMMTALREAFPDYVRIQATLVLMQQNVEARYQEFSKLKEISPNHPLVRLAGSAIQKEYEINRAVKDATLPEAGVAP
jgi:hypothetical protein